METELKIKVMPRIIRGCGVRKTGGLYIFCGGEQMDCYRFPMPLPEACPCCGEELRQLRSVRIIDPSKLWGNCTDMTHPCHKFKCFGCFPPDKAGLMWVGKEYYTPEQFIMEAGQYGVSKRVRVIPNNLKVGDKLFLVHNEAFPAKNEDGTPRGSRVGVFFATTITEFHKILSEKQSNDLEYINDLIKRGITPVLEVGEDVESYTKTCIYDEPQKSILDFK